MEKSYKENQLIKIIMKPETQIEDLLKIYRQKLTQFARNLYLKANEISREINESKFNEEDLEEIKSHIISLINSKQ